MNEAQQLFDAADELALLPDDVYWLFAKGKTRPNEPLFGIQLQDKNGKILFQAEHDDPCECVRLARSGLDEIREAKA
jgi:hypothetical protein